MNGNNDDTATTEFRTPKMYKPLIIMNIFQRL